MTSPGYQGRFYVGAEGEGHVGPPDLLVSPRFES